MNQKTFLGVTGIIFLLLTVLHIARVVFGWNVVIGSFTVPLWVSFIAIAVGGFLFFQSWKLMKK